MSIRLSKVISELNIGLQTAIDYLKKKNLGEIEDDAKPSTKITDEQYSALVAEFKGDQAVKHEAEKIFIKKAKEKKQEKVEKKALKAEELLEQRPQFKPVGKIDLDALNGKKPATPAVPKPEPEPAAPVTVEPKEAPVVEPKLKPESPKEEVQPETVAPVAEIKPVTTQQPVEPEKPAAAEEDEKSEEKSGPAIYTLKSEAKMAPKVNVLGKIDLSSINQSTRPKKKTKEERRKEREEKAAQQNGERKKRERIRGGKERVDIEAAGNQQNQGGNNGKKNKGGQQNNQQNGQQQGGGKKKKNRPVQKPLEVDEEAVARLADLESQPVMIRQRQT